MATYDYTTGQGAGAAGSATGLSKMMMVERVFDAKSSKMLVIHWLMVISFN